MADHAKNWTLNVPLCSTHQKSERPKKQSATNEKMEDKKEKRIATPLNQGGEEKLDQTTQGGTARLERPKQHLNPICTSAQSRESKKQQHKIMADRAKIGH